MKYNLSAWMQAIRPRTRPLALSSTILGSFIAASEHQFNLRVFILASLTTLFLQILSNLANDYGDYTKGTDSTARLGPKRMVQSGLIKPLRMILAIIIVVSLSLISGSLLILEGTRGTGAGIKIFYFILGIGAILAAVKYTIGKKPYGYIGLGDLFVFIFFGLAGVIGTYYLHTHHLRLDVLLPATSVGFLSVGVLNINNIRDYQSDKKASKRTMVVLIGSQRAKFYHLSLLIGAVITGSLYTLINFESGYQWLFLITTPMLFMNILSVYKYTRPLELNAELKKLAFSTLLFSFTFGIGLLI
ncbi:MAG: 1,4-dihydroxy-2-naphthoate polyprenyltransferase [Bacteroidales bacterium]|nr:1,4-dihydroxy-2-naphthoate polyprenyltransferase [Bacteroidales bacterium]